MLACRLLIYVKTVRKQPQSFRLNLRERLRSYL